MSAIVKRRKELRNELQQLEKQIYDLETNYLEETKDFGNIFVGWTSYLSHDKIKQKKNIQNEERLFSLSSVTSPATKKEDAKRVNRSSINSNIADGKKNMKNDKIVGLNK